LWTSVVCCAILYTLQGVRPVKDTIEPGSGIL
jgi:hypothetical protein